MFQGPKNEDSSSNTQFGFHLLCTLGCSGPFASPSNMDTIMSHVTNPSSDPSPRFLFGINGMNRLISQMPKQPNLSIEFQKTT